MFKKILSRQKMIKCKHEEVEEVTTFGDEERTFKCVKCGKRLKMKE